jgi:hypothetical protein
MNLPHAPTPIVGSLSDPGLECFNCGKDVPKPEVVFEREVRDRFGRCTVRDTICSECKAKAEALS